MAHDIGSPDGRKVRVLQVTLGLGAELGGTAVAVARLSNALVARGDEVYVLGLRNGLGQEVPEGLDPRVRVFECRTIGWHRLGFSLDVGRVLCALPLFDVIHIHGLWRLHYGQVVRYAWRHKLPVVVSVHGMMEPWALNYKKWPKRLARAVYQDHVLNRATCLHATAPEEAETLGSLGVGRAIAVIPWGVEEPRGDLGRSRSSVRARFGIAEGARVALVLSRLHPVKGLDTLLSAWSRVHRAFNEWMLLVAGHDESGYRLELLRLARTLGIQDRVVFAGPLRGQEKEDVFAAAELFVLPSRSENFGLVVPEALARGLPVITTDGTPWSRIAEWGCGWWIGQGADPLARVLMEALRKSPPELRRMGERGRACVETHFSAEASAGRMTELYRWLLGRGPQPGFIRVG